MSIEINYGSWDRLAIVYNSLCYFELLLLLVLLPFASSLFLLLFLLLLLLPLGYIFCIQST
jgi:hypothetical protein